LYYRLIPGYYTFDNSILIQVEINNMKEILEDYIREQVKKPKDSEIKDILHVFEEKDLKKGSFFKAPFTTSKEFGFLVKGSLRLVIFKENGEEITARLLQEYSFITDVFSIRDKVSTPIGIECLEEVSILVTPIDKINHLLETNLAFNILMREYITVNALEMGRNHLLFLTGTAKERYQFILENNPNLLKKFPLRYIASLIGITPTQLSRIRNNKID